MSGRRPFLRSIRARVALAMLVPLAVALIVIGWTSVSSVSRTVGRSESERISDAGQLLPEIARTLVSAPPRSEFLGQVAAALGGEILVVDRDRGEVRTTLEGARATAAVSWAQSGGMRDDAPPGEPVAVDVGGAPYLVLGEKVGAHDVYLLYAGDPVRDAVDGALRPLVRTGVVVLVIATALAFVLASLITRPLERLAAEAAVVADGDLDHEVTVASRDETGELAGSFNRMLVGLRRYRANLVRSERLAILGRLASSVAHELRNPLTAIRMNVQMLPGEDDAARRAEDAAQIVEEIDRLERVVDELLTFARPAPLELGDVDVRELIEGAVEVLRRQMDHLRVEVEVVVPGNAVPTLRADGARLRRVVMNLLLNAAQAMPEGGRARIEAEDEDEDEGVRLTVSDEGAGVPADLLTDLFEPFVSGHADGTGLGLAISRQIVEAHGGTIAHRREQDRTVFEVRIPSGPAPRRESPRR